MEPRPGAADGDRRLTTGLGRSADVMRGLPLTLLLLLAGAVLSIALWFATGGRMVFVILPLIVAAPFVWRRRR